MIVRARAGVGRRCRTGRVLAAMVLVVCGATAVGACSSSDESSTTTTAAHAATSSTTTTAPTTSAPPGGTGALLGSVCAGTATVTDVATVESPEITEASGLAASRREPGDWWIHNDSGDSARVFVLGSDGQVRSTVRLAGATARDWEDIDVGPPTSPHGGATVYVADIGDNAMVKQDTANARSSVQVYRFQEPELTGAHLTVRPDQLTFTYPDGPHDAETLLVDPRDGSLYVVTKEWGLRGSSGVYRAPAGLPAGSTTVLEHVGDVPLDAGTLVTGGDISPDGSVIALRSYADVRLYRRDPGTSVADALGGTPCHGPGPVERQGEALGFSVDGGSYLTVSEGDRPVLHRTAPPVASQDG